MLVVCTANQCRSPLAGGLLVREARLHDLPVDVLSAGIATTAGRPATPSTIDAADAIGVELRAHRSRPLDRGLVAAADLFVGMERLHVREAVVLEPAVWRRAFTLPDLVRRADPRGIYETTQDGVDLRFTVFSGDPITAYVEAVDPTDWFDFRPTMWFAWYSVH